jgi:diguanylate cyclase (GGDEF)-like protein
MSKFCKEKFHKIKERRNNKKKHTIMIVDDEEDLLKEIGSFFSRDYDVITARDGREALAHIRGMEQPESIGLIISDQQMPGLTGIELFERLIPIIPHTKRIILTGYPEKSVIIDSINKARIHEFILKPFDPDEFKLRVRRALEAYDCYQEVVRASITDYLTGIGNRRHLELSIKREVAKIHRDYENWRRGRVKRFPAKNNLCFLMLDLDFFRSVNNAYGHQAGDKVLRQLSDVLKDKCRHSDILGRWGGEEFLVVSCSIARGEGRDLVERLHQAVKDYPFQLGEGHEPIHLTCSIGYADYPFLPGAKHHPDTIPWTRVLNLADMALYAMKNSGRNAWAGITASEKIDPKDLYERIQEDIKVFINQGELDIISSLPVEDLVWEKSWKISEPGKLF